MSDSTPLVPMQLSRLVLRDGSDQQWLYLTERDGERGFPIIIGTGEAGEIHRVVTSVRTERPLTHQLATQIVEGLGSRVVRVDIVDLRNNTFYARLVLEDPGGGDPIEVDARPSDALAVGLRSGAPIHVAESVLEQARTDTSKDPLPPANGEADEDEDAADDDDDEGTPPPA